MSEQLSQSASPTAWPPLPLRLSRLLDFQPRECTPAPPSQPRADPWQLQPLGGPCHALPHASLLPAWEGAGSRPRSEHWLLPPSFSSVLEAQALPPGLALPLICTCANPQSICRGGTCWLGPGLIPCFHHIRKVMPLS